MKISNELKIGFWAIVAIVTLFLGTNYLKGIHTFSSGQMLYLSTSQVNGLDVSSHITLHGLKVGMVRSMNYDKASDRVIVKLNVYDDDMLIPTDSRFTVAADLLGTSEVVLTLGESTQYYHSGDTILADTGEPGLLEKADPIVDQVTQLMPKIDSLVSGINVLVNESKLHESLLEVNKLTQQLNRTVNQLNRMLQKDVPALVNNLQDMTANFDTLSVQLKEADLKQLISHTDETLRSANELIQQLQTADSSVGKLTTTTELHDQLVSTIADMDSLINDIKQHPKRYINVKVF